MRTMGFDVTTQTDDRPTLGLIVLQADETLEQEFRQAFMTSDVAIHTSRIPSGEALNADTIAAMEAELPRSAGLLPRAAQFDAVAYGCTSGTTLIGAQAVASLVRQGVQTPHVTDPLTAALAALRYLNISKLGLVTPYVESIAAPVADAFCLAGLETTETLTFGEEVEARVARISADAIKAAARQAAHGAEAVFLSCTNLQTFEVIAPLEAELGLPVLSSNQVLAWHLAQLSNMTSAGSLPGLLSTS